MVLFKASMDRAPSVITRPAKFNKVYMVGDSRTVDTKRALKSSIPSNVTYMRKVSAALKKYNCKMYYLSVNPVNSTMIKARRKKFRSEASIAAFNKVIYEQLCSGKNRSFTYINTCTRLQKYGWSSNRYNAGIHDGLHYSDQTYLRIFNYCMKYLNH